MALTPARRGWWPGRDGSRTPFYVQLRYLRLIVFAVIKEGRFVGGKLRMVVGSDPQKYPPFCKRMCVWAYYQPEWYMVSHTSQTPEGTPILGCAGWSSWLAYIMDL